jgi:hypothetical protein
MLRKVYTSTVVLTTMSGIARFYPKINPSSIGLNKILNVLVKGPLNKIVIVVMVFDSL